MFARAWHSLAVSTRWLLRSRTQERDLNDELRYHVDTLVDEFRARGLSEAEARRAALRQMDGTLRHHEACRETHRSMLIDQAGQDLVFAWRMMKRAPLVSIAAILTLGIGIGAATAVFSLLRGALVPPYPNADRIVWAFETTPDGRQSPVSTLNFRDWQQHTTAFDHLTAWGFGELPVGDAAAPTVRRTLLITPGYFETFGMAPMLGRGFRPEENERGNHRVAVLSHELWTASFGADPAAVGAAIRIQGEPYTVVGVMPKRAGSIDWSWTELWVPMTFEAANTTREHRSFNVYGMLKPGVTLAQARADLSRVAASLAAEYPADAGWGAGLERHTDIMAGRGLRRALWLLLAAGVFLLLLVSMNLAGLLLARALAREREVAIRGALGGGRSRLIRQFLTESAVLGVCGAVCGLLFAVAGVRALQVMLPSFSAPNAGIPPASVLALDWPVLLFGVGAAAISVATFGLVPALVSSRSDLAVSMREGGHGTGTSATRVRLRTLLVTGEIAIAFVLLVGAALLLRSVSSLKQTELGFTPAGVLTVTLPLEVERRQSNPEVRLAYFDSLLAASRGLPGVEIAALASVLPLRGWGVELPFEIPGRPLPASGRSTGFFKSVTPGYFNVLDLGLRRGRFFTDQDGRDSAPVAVINETMARRFFGTDDPIGRRIVMPEIVQAGRMRLGADLPREIVGVVADERVNPLRDSRESPGVYVPLAQSVTRQPFLLVTTSLPPARFERELRLAVARVSPGQALADVQPLQVIVDQAIGPDRQRSVLLAFLAAIAAALAALGIYGVMSHVASQRANELRVRIALGAAPVRVAGVVLRRGLAMTAAGILAGALLTVPLSSLLAGMLVGVSPRDVAAIASAFLVVLCASLAACGVPALRAARLDPADLLRHG